MRRRSELEKEVLEILKDYSRDMGNTLEGTIEYVLREGAMVIPVMARSSSSADFYEMNKYDIWKLITEMSEEQGYENVFEFLATLKGADYVYDDSSLKSLLARLAFEEITYRMSRR